MKYSTYVKPDPIPIFPKKTIKMIPELSKFKSHGPVNLVSKKIVNPDELNLDSICKERPKAKQSLPISCASSPSVNKNYIIPESQDKFHIIKN